MNQSLELDGLAGLPAAVYTVWVNNRASMETEESNEGYTLHAASVDFTLNRPLLIEYSLDQSEYGPEDTLVVSYSIDNQGGEPFDIQVGMCEPYIALYDVSDEAVVVDTSTLDLTCPMSDEVFSVEPGRMDSATTSLSLTDPEIGVDIDPGIYYLKLSFNDFVESESFWVVDGHFNDIEGHWAEEYITQLQLEGVVEGSSFDDVDEEDWSYIYTESAYEEEIVSGYENNTFGPNNEITRAEATSIVLAARD